MRPACAGKAQPRVGRVVFSSSEDLTRAARAKVVAAEATFVSWMTVAAEGLFATLFPSDCRLCGTPLVKISRLPVCEECLQSIRPLGPRVCASCGERLIGPYQLTNQHGEAICGLCRQSEPVFVKAAAYGSYEGGLRDLIHLLKYQHVRPAAAVLGRMLSEVIEHLVPCFEGSLPVVVPVPLHASKRRERGFNQVDLFTRAALKLRPAGLELKFCPDVLMRARPTASQTGLTLHQRRENMRGAFHVACAGAIENSGVLLVDDVMTTGITVSECTRVLRRAGAARVWVATVARTLKHETTFMVADASLREDETRLSMAAHG
jgi:ComF family protein